VTASMLAILIPVAMLVLRPKSGCRRLPSPR
jgi:hypothetical protein